MSYARYNYGDREMNAHKSFLYRVGALGRPKGLGRGPKGPPIHTAKSTKDKESRAAKREYLKSWRSRSKKFRVNEQRVIENKANRIERDEKRADRQPCGHGKRHKSKYDGQCRRCFAS